MHAQRTQRLAPRAPQQRSSLRRKLFVQTYILMTLAITGVGIATIGLAMGSHRASVSSMLQSEVSALGIAVESSMSRNREALARLDRDPAEVERTLPDARAIVDLRPDGAIDRWYGTQDIPEDSLRRAALGMAFIEPIVTRAGWISTVIAQPLRSSRGSIRVALVDARPLLQSLQSHMSRGTIASIVLDQRGELLVLHATDTDATFTPASLGAARTAQTKPLWHAIGGSRAVVDAPDYAGIRSLATYQALPSIGGAIGASIDNSTAMAPVLRLAFQLSLVGLALITLLSPSVLLLSRRIVGPLEDIAHKLSSLETHRWQFAPTIHTGDELELVDRTAVDLTARLRASYDHLESIVRDRTEALRRQLAENEAMFQSVDYGIVVTDAQGLVTFANPSFEQIVGSTTQSMHGVPIETVLPIATKDGIQLKPSDHPVRIVLASGAAFRPVIDPEFSLMIPQASEKAIQVRATPMLRGHTCVGVVTVLRDTTDERRIDRIKSEFISLVSHQLRTPLSSMRWYLEMLLGDDGAPLTSEQREQILEVATANARMVHLVNGLLNVSRMEMGKLQVTPEVVDAHALMQSTASTFHLELRQKRMTTDLTIGTLDGITLHSDRALVQLILENLISNAIKYGPEGSAVRLRIDGDRAEKTIKICVADSGIGIPAEQQGRIGQRLFRGKNARLSSTDGNGLGLYISMIAAQTIGGTLTFESAEGKGTTFCLTLPVTIDATAMPASRTEAQVVTPATGARP